MKSDSPTQPGFEAIILAGGLGTRLRSVVSDLPKCMAPVAGNPFLYHVIKYLRQQGVTRFIFSLGYLHQLIETYVQQYFPGIEATFSVESEPLGTGGAIQLACSNAHNENVLVVNGDTLYKADIPALFSFHLQQKANCTLALKPMQHFDRYGVVTIDGSGLISSFKEKQFYESGLINGGVYVLNRKEFLQQQLVAPFSFEKDYLEKQTGSGKLFGLKQEGYFIDIGIPEDFERAQVEL